MDPEIQAQLEEMKRQIDSLSEQVRELTENPIKFPVPDELRKNIGIGFVGKTTDTVAVGALLCNSNEGPIKLLYTT